MKLFKTLSVTAMVAIAIVQFNFGIVLWGSEIRTLTGHSNRVKVVRFGSIP